MSSGLSPTAPALPSLSGTADRRPMARGWLGMALFAAAEATVVGSIIGSYVYLRINTHSWPPRGTPLPTLLDPIVLTVLLLVTIVPLRVARRAAQEGRRSESFLLLAVATATQAVYLGVQLHLFIASLDRFTPQTSAYASIYYVLLGAAHAHVAVGLLIDLWLLARLARRLTPYRVVALEAATLYWQVVAGITIAVVVTELSPRL